MQSAIIFTIVLICAFYLGRRFYRQVKQSRSGGCGGSCGCSSAKDEIPQKSIQV